MPEPTYYAKILHEKLIKRGIRAKLEYNDGHKSVDIFIPEANLEIEIDGSHHNEPLQAFRDLLRTKHSMLKGKETIHVPNALVYNYPSQTADLIEEIIQNRIVKKEKGEISKVKQMTLEQTLPKKTIEKYKIKFNMAKARKFFEEKRKIRNKKIIKFSVLLGIIIIIGIFLFFIINKTEKNVENNTKNLLIENEKNKSYNSAPEIKPIVVESSKTDVIIKNNQQESISLNITYRIYSNWFGIDSQISQVFDVGANSQESFKVYNNDGCLTAPCSVSIISYEEI